MYARSVQCLLVPSSSLCSRVASLCNAVPSSLSRNHPQTDLSTTRARLLYQSKKRGILENDILLGEFAESHLPKMNAAELAEYDKLINGEHMEWDLFYYISDRKQPPKDIFNMATFRQLKSFVEAKKRPN
ncbi:hypothetical protein WR25_06849 [Diploscapter pachys]|uniref:SDH assembly factor 2 n=1 Tax=Diploscapter pachys TaxID=2018661 RepID=A0A2A2L5G7_9BILA|nr:hypothetical protein WR25_06849 [Diploscapter pachys]